MAESIRAVFNTNAQVLRFLPDEGEPYSIRRWMTADKRPGAILFITSDYEDLELNSPLLTLWTNLSITSLMSMPRTEEHPSALQSLMRISYAVFCLKKKRTRYNKS